MKRKYDLAEVEKALAHAEELEKDDQDHTHGWDSGHELRVLRDEILFLRGVLDRWQTGERCYRVEKK